MSKLDQDFYNMGFNYAWEFGKDNAIKNMIPEGSPIQIDSYLKGVSAFCEMIVENYLDEI